MSEELKRKLEQVEDRLRGLREDRKTAVAARDKAKEEYGQVPDGTDDSAQYEAAREAVRRVGEIDDNIAAESEKQVELLKMLGDKEAGKREPRPGVARIDEESGEVWSSAHLFEDPELLQQLEKISASQSKFGSLELGQVASRDVMVADVDPSSYMRRGTYRGVIPQLRRVIRLLDLIPTGATDGNSVPYTQESGPFTGALETAEGSAKPEASMTYTDADAPVRTIAAWLKTRKQGLADFAALRTIIDSRLRYLVLRRLEAQVVNGDGSGVNLRGLLQTSGIGSVAYQSTLPLTELILSGITNIYLADGEAEGVALYPTDWQKALTEKAKNGAGTVGSYEYIGGGPFGNTPMTIWGIPCIPTASMPVGHGLVADFSLAATLLIREGVNVLMSDSDQDDFIKNRVTLLGEMRAALPVWRPAVIQDVLTA